MGERARNKWLNSSLHHQIGIVRCGAGMCRAVRIIIIIARPSGLTTPMTQADPERWNINQRC